MDSKLSYSETPPGTTLRFKNSPSDVETFFCDGVHSVSVTNGILRLGLAEQIPDTNGETVLRYVANVSLPKEALQIVHDLLGHVIEQLAAIDKAGQ